MARRSNSPATAMEGFSADDKRHRATGLYLKGWPQFRIAEELGVTPARVCQMLKEVRNEWRERYAEDYSLKVDEELAKLNHLEQVCWERFLVSCKGYSGVDRKGNEFTAAERAGDVRFLERVESCIVNRLKVLGAFRDVTVNNDNRKIEVNGQPAFDFAKLYGRAPGAGGEGEGDDPVEQKVREAERRALKAAPAPQPESNGHKNGRPRKKE